MTPLAKKRKVISAHVCGHFTYQIHTLDALQQKPATAVCLKPHLRSGHPPYGGTGGAMLPHVGATDVMAHFSFMYRNDSTHFRETLRSGFHGQNGERSKQRPMRAPFRWLWRNLARNFVPGGGLVCLKCYHSVYSIAVVL